MTPLAFNHKALSSSDALKHYFSIGEYLANISGPLLSFPYEVGGMKIFRQP